MVYQGVLTSCATGLLIDACIDKKPIITVDDIKKLIEKKNPHILINYYSGKSSTNLVQNQYWKYENGGESGLDILRNPTSVKLLAGIQNN